MSSDTKWYVLFQGRVENVLFHPTASNVSVEFLYQLGRFENHVK